jgi:RNA polymerase sigma-70 factor, ECF subfamily
VAEVDGPAAALLLVDDLDHLDGYHIYHAVRADLLARLGRRDEARTAFDRAAALTANPVEREHLERCRGLA